MTAEQDGSSSHSKLAKVAEKAQKITHVPFRVYEHRLYDVEIAFNPNGDVIYHFYPKKGKLEFPFNERVTGMLLEDAYIWAVGQIDAQADFFDKDTAKYFYSPFMPGRTAGQPTFSLKVLGVSGRLGAEKILVDRFLGRFDKLMDDAARLSMSGGAKEIEKKLREKRWRD